MSKAIQLKNRSGEKIYPCPYYPVGSIYLSVNNTNPGTIFGGTWEQIKDRFLLACGNSYSNGSTGGSTTHRHDFRVGFEQYYGLFIGDTLENQGAYSYSQSKYSKSYGRQSGTTRVVANNNISYTSTQNINDYIRYSDGDTQTASSLPPYLAIYVWKRVS